MGLPSCERIDPTSVYCVDPPDGPRTQPLSSGSRRETLDRDSIGGGDGDTFPTITLRKVKRRRRRVARV